MRRLSELEKSEIWDRFEGDESQRSISRGLDRPPSTIRSHLVSAGFWRPLPAGDWVSLRLSLSEREEISRGLATGESLRGIAVRLGRAPSTVSRELAANGVGGSSPSTPTTKPLVVNGGFWLSREQPTT